MNNLQNKSNVHLMIWETDPTKRNINNEIKFNLKEDIELVVGDKIRCYLDQQKESVYTITEILETRKSSFSGYNYITAKSSWKIETV